MRKLSPKQHRPVGGLVIDPRAAAAPDADAPGVIRLLDVEPTAEQRSSHALRLLNDNQEEDGES